MVGLLATLGLLVLVAAPAVLACRMADREEAQRNLIGLIAEQADDRAIADNLDV